MMTNMYLLLQHAVVNLFYFTNISKPVQVEKTICYLISHQTLLSNMKHTPAVNNEPSLDEHNNTPKLLFVSTETLKG